MADDGAKNDDGKGTGGGKGPLGDLVKAESMIQAAIALPAGCLIGWFLGSWLDRHFHQEWISVAGIVLGAIGGFIQIFSVASKFLKRGDS
jgi:positive regulator of sigma E activity